jgi:hypothetical protein
MIERHWHGRVPSRHAGRFAGYLRAAGMAAAAAVPAMPAQGYGGPRTARRLISS